MNEYKNQYNESQQYNNSQYQQQYYEALPQNNYQYTGMPPQPQEEKANVGLAILSFLIPLIGLILYLTQKKDKPKTAKLCGKCALISFIINIVITIIMYAVMGAAVSSVISDDNFNPSSYLENYSEGIKDDSNDGEIVSDNTLGDYVCVIKGAEKCTDYEGKDAILITYDFTNNSDSENSFDFALEAKAFQDEIDLETAYLGDDEIDNLVDVDIKPGITKEVKKAYLLRNTSSEVEIEISELFSFTGDKIVTTVTL